MYSDMEKCGPGGVKWMGEWSEIKGAEFLGREKETPLDLKRILKAQIYKRNRINLLLYS